MPYTWMLSKTHIPQLKESEKRPNSIRSRLLQARDAFAACVRCGSAAQFYIVPALVLRSANFSLAFERPSDHEKCRNAGIFFIFMKDRFVKKKERKQYRESNWIKLRDLIPLNMMRYLKRKIIRTIDLTEFISKFTIKNLTEI